MNIGIKVLQKDYDKFYKHKTKIRCKNYDEYMNLFYFDVYNRCSLSKPGDKIYFLINGYYKYYATIKHIQPKLIPLNAVRIFFNNIKENNDKREVKNFYGIKYLDDIIFDPTKKEG